MNKRELRQFRWAFPMMILGLSIAGCSARQSQPSPSSIPAASPIPTLVEITPTAEVLSDEPTITPTIITTPMLESVADTGVRYTDKFEDPATGWPQEEFDNYFIGYHEPDYYHINIRSSNDKELVPVPNKESYGDITVEAEILTDLNNTAESGDFRYGVAFRRSGDQYYVFAISPRSGKWYVLKSSPDHLEVLKEGSDDSIQGLDALDTLQVDVKGTNFYFHINDQLIDQVSDSDYAEGEVGLFVQTLDTPRVHAHFDSITIRDVDAPQDSGTVVRYADIFEDPATGWPQEEFDNYFIGYHEPDYYHINVRSSNDKELVPVPNKESYGDITVEAEVLTDLNNTAESGDYRYGVAFRRSGDQYYVFAISPRSGKWYVLKSSPDHLEVLKEGSDDSIQGLDALDTLQVDVRGTNFYFHINDQLIDQVSDSDYAEGEVGLFVQTLDTPRVHAHFDSITIRDVDAPQQACKVDSFGIRMRRGPSTSFDPIGFLTHGDTVEPQGRNPDANWIQVRVEDSDRRGWIFYDPDWISCNVATSDLPVVEP